MEFNLSSLEPEQLDLRKQCKQVHLINNTDKGNPNVMFDRPIRIDRHMEHSDF